MTRIASVSALAVAAVVVLVIAVSGGGRSTYDLQMRLRGTDLDQVLDVLDQNTRARLAVLLNEAGQAFTGRRQDFGDLLNQLPSALSDGTALLGQLVNDNHSLASLITNSNGFVGQVNSHS